MSRGDEGAEEGGAAGVTAERPRGHGAFGKPPGVRVRPACGVHVEEDGAQGRARVLEEGLPLPGDGTHPWWLPSH